MKSIFVLPLASIALFVLSTATEKDERDACCYGMNPIKFKSEPWCRKYADVQAAIENAKLREEISKVEAYEDRVRAHWKAWFGPMKEQMEKDVENVANECAQKLENDWGEFMKNIEQKWMHFNPDMEKEYKCKVYPGALKWGVTKWIAWFHETALPSLKQDFKKGISKCGKEYHQKMKEKLNVWHKKYLDEWCKQDWKERENRYYKTWRTWAVRTDRDYLVKLARYNSWWERVSSEHKEWTNNLKEIEYNCSEWVNWKKEKLDSYKQWLQDFTKKWITDEQWNTWNKERKEYLLKNKPETTKKPAGKTATKKAPAKKKPVKK